MKLTRRQEVFIQKMIELKTEFVGPIHYSVLAERLGVSPFTAYDMLCLLEEKGFITSVYQLPADKSGPGRAERVFFPSEKAHARHRHVVEQAGGDPLDSEALKAFVLEQLRENQMPYQELADQMMARLLPNAQGEERYCVEVMTIAALRLEQDPGRQMLADHLSEFLPGDPGSDRSNLCLLAGFVYGLLASQCTADQEWLEKLREHLRGYMDLVIQLSTGQCKRLADQLSGVFASLVEAHE